MERGNRNESPGSRELMEAFSSFDILAKSGGYSHLCRQMVADGKLVRVSSFHYHD
jgi:hypothetical protein